MDWTRRQIIGRGSTATVYVATFNNSGQPFAVKSAELRRSELLQKEQRILSQLNCPQIVAYKGHEITEENGKLLYNIKLEYAAGGTVTDAIRRRGGVLDEAMIRSYTREILIGLQHLHCNGIVHCDIKGQNILVTNEGAKIADLGCARMLFDDWFESTPIAGTPVYMAPEVARGEHQGFPSDVWSLGCTVVEMATGKAPWKNVSDPVSALYQIGFSEDVPEIPSFMSKQGKDFISKCLMRDPNERWSVSELLNHAFIAEEGLNSCNLETPTSVLDQRVWESSEEIVLNAHKTSSSRSPLQRVLQLAQCIRNNPASWEWDGSWITVRARDSLKETSLNEGNGKNVIWVSGEFNYIAFVSNQPLIPTVGGISTFNTTISGGCKETTTFLKLLLMLCVSVKFYLFVSCNFENEIIKDPFFNIEVLAYYRFIIMRYSPFKLETFLFSLQYMDENVPMEPYPNGHSCII